MAGGLGYHFESEWFRAKIDLREHQRIGVNCEESHFSTLLSERCGL
jgi:hypothetical protein